MIKRNGFLDIAKGAAIVMVLITHYDWSDKWRLNLLFPYWVSMAVPLFMLITGYLSAASFERGGITDIKKAYEIKPLIKKLARYTLPFLYMYIAEIIIKTLSGNVPKPLEIIVYFFGGGFGEWGTYYFPVLVQITLIFPLIFFVVKNKKLGLPVCFILTLGLEILKNAVEMSGGVYRLLAFRYIFVVAAGCYIYLYGKSVGYRLQVAACAVGALYIWLVNYTAYEPKIFVFWTATTMLTTFYIAPIFTAGTERAQNWRCAPLELIGRASYHIFLAQIIYYNYVAPLVYDAVSIKALELIISIAASLAMGLGYYYLYNKIKKIKNR